jgi:hypothetical protein
VERIGKGGFWLSGTVRRAGDGAPLAGQRIQIWAHTTEGREEEQRSHGATLTDKNGALSPFACRSPLQRQVLSSNGAVRSTYWLDSRGLSPWASCSFSLC